VILTFVLSILCFILYYGASSSGISFSALICNTTNGTSLSTLVTLNPPNPLNAVLINYSCDYFCHTVSTLIQTQRKASSWNGYYPKIGDFLVNRSLESGIFIEIGTAYGGLSSYLLNHFPKLHYIAIDPFMGGYDTGDAMSQQLDRVKTELKLSPQELSTYWAYAYEREFSYNFGNRFKLIHTFSCLGSLRVTNFSVDAIFIDGLHTKKGVDADISCWQYKVKVGSPLIFNDWKIFPGVKQSVLEFLGKEENKNKTLVMIDDNNVAVY